MAAGPVEAAGLGGLGEPAGPGRRDNAGDEAIDSVYALGKSIYMGDGQRVRGLTVCLSVYEKDDDGPRAVRISRDVLKPFKGRPVIALATRLVDCEAPSSQVALLLDRVEFRALVYFLNKRFRLRLKS